MKKGALTLFLLNLIGFASAYGSYYDFSIGDLLYNLNPDDVFLIIVFGLFAFFLTRTFRKVFGGRTGLSRGSWVPAILLSFGLTYGIYTTNFSISDFFYSLGFSQGGLEAVLWVVGIGLFILCLWKKWLEYLLLSLGALMIFLAFVMNWYQKGAAIVIGIILMLLGFLLWRWRRRSKLHNEGLPPLNYGKKAKKLKEKQEYNYYQAQEEQKEKMLGKLERDKKILQKTYNKYNKEIKRLRKKDPNNPRINLLMEKLRIINRTARRKGINLS